MLTLRCTRKLLDRLGPPAVDPPPSTTVLGDWYAKPFPVGQRRFIILASAQSRLALLMPGRDVATLPQHFPDYLAVQLTRLGVPEDLRQQELDACREVTVAATDDKSLLATLNEYAADAKHRMSRRDGDLHDEAFSLSHTPISALGFRFPAEVALELFGIESHRRRPF